MDSDLLWSVFSSVLRLSLKGAVSLVLLLLLLRFFRSVLDPRLRRSAVALILLSLLVPFPFKATWSFSSLISRAESRFQRRLAAIPFVPPADVSDSSPREFPDLDREKPGRESPQERESVDTMFWFRYLPRIWIIGIIVFAVPLFFSRRNRNQNPGPRPLSEEPPEPWRTGWPHGLRAVVEIVHWFNPVVPYVLARVGEIARPKASAVQPEPPELAGSRSASAWPRRVAAIGGHLALVGLLAAAWLGPSPPRKVPPREPWEGIVHSYPLRLTNYSRMMVLVRAADFYTGVPIRRFSVVHTWEATRMTKLSMGVFSHRSLEVSNGLSREVFLPDFIRGNLQVEAVGYRTLDSGLIYRQEGSQALLFRLKRATAFTGKVQTEKGEPVPDAEVAIWGGDSRGPQWNGSRLWKPGGAQCEITRTDAHGEFKAFPPMLPKRAAAICSQGFVGAIPLKAKDATNRIVLTLKKWAGIEGSMMRSDSPVVGCRVVAYDGATGDDPAALQLLLTVVTDHTGQFRLTNVPPGVVFFGPISGIKTRLVLEPGEVRSIQLRGAARVRGHVFQKHLGRALTPIEREIELDINLDWPSQQIWLIPTNGLALSQPGIPLVTRHLEGRIAEDGQFVFEDVPPGTYYMNLSVRKMVVRDEWKTYTDFPLLATRLATVEVPNAAAAEGKTIETGQIPVLLQSPFRKDAVPPSGLNRNPRIPP